MTKPELLDKIVGLLGGRVAEEIVFGEVSTGAHNDFQRATGIARRMVTEFGMSDKLGPLQFGQSQGGQVFLGRDFNNEQNYSDAIAYEIDLEIQRIIKESYERAKQILTENRDKLDLIANTLLEVETLDADQIKHLFEKGKLPERTYKSLNGNLDSEGNEDSDVKVNIGSKNEDEQAVNPPVEEGDTPEIKEQRESEQTPPIQEGRPQDKPLSFPDEDNKKL